MSNQSKKVRFIVYGGVLAALSIILYFIEFPIIPGLNYLKIDASDLPAVIAGVLLSPFAAVAVELIKVIVHVVIVGFGSTMGFGDLISFIVGSALTVSYSAVFRSMAKHNDRKILNAVAAGATGLIAMTAVGVIANYFIAPPYFNFMLHVKLTSAMLWAAIGGASTLNVVKSILIMIVMLPILGIFKKRIKNFDI